ncbi:MAG: helix-turn-helix domain-containing protein [Desulfobacterales bacterium]|nr:helix-turn-helix domain-containing protein [Desulfobacterales bacterium]
MTEILEKKDVAKMFKLPKSTIDRMVTMGQIPFIRMGKRSVRFSRDRLEKWLEERENVEVTYNRD